MALFIVEAHKKKVFLTVSTQVYQYTNANFANEVFFYDLLYTVLKTCWEKKHYLL